MQGAAQANATADVAASIKRPAAPTPHNTPSANKAQRRALKPRERVKSLVRNASVAMTSPKLVGAIDQGTTSTRFILYRVVGDGVLQPLASHQMEHKQIYPKPGWCEHDPEEIYANTLTCIAKALEAVPGGATASDVACVGITNQRETTVAWSKRTGKPLHNAVVWLDMRTSDLCDSLTAEVMGGDKDAFRGVCGLPISTYFAGVKMRWLLDNCDAVKAAAAEGDLAFGTIDSWLLHKLTGAKAHVTDVTNASRTMLMDLATQTWHEPTAEKLGVPIDSLPSIVSCAEEYGVLAEGALSGVKLTGCLGDQHAATLGQRCDVGGAKNTYGTGCFMLLNTGDEKVESTHGLLTTMAWRLGKDAKPVYALEGSVAIAGAGVQWLRDNLGVIKSASDVEPLAASVPDVGGVYFVPAFSGLFAPRWRPDARGVCVGLTQFTTKAHLARALLEAICFQTVDVLEAMRKDAKDLDMTALHVDGGATANGLLMQTQADLLGVRVFRPANVETTAMGAALAAGVGAGLFSERAAFEENPADEAIADEAWLRDELANRAYFEPAIGADERARRYAGWCDAVERSLNLAPQQGE